MQPEIKHLILTFLFVLKVNIVLLYEISNFDVHTALCFKYFVRTAMKIYNFKHA